MEGNITITMTQREAEQLYWELYRLLKFAEAEGTTRDDKTQELLKELGTCTGR